MTVATQEIRSGASRGEDRRVEMYRWVDHTGEMELEIEAPDEAAIFHDAVAALAELIAEEDSAEPASIELDVSARDRGALLAGDRLVASVEGHRGDVAPLVKGVTYHRLRFERSGTGWKAGAVLDV
jgi:SHS2 domain-containing protein